MSKSQFIRSVRPRPAAVQRRRIGVFAGTFDPVHAGHIAFALQAMAAAGLDDVVFLPERRPRHKPGVEHYAHRVAMIVQAIQPHPQFSVLELVDRHFTVSRTLPQLRALFAGHQLVLLVGSDVATHIDRWPYYDQLFRHMELVIGARSDQNQPEIQTSMDAWTTPPHNLIMFDSYAADISSSRIREALRCGDHSKGLLASVKKYAMREWLYVSPNGVIRGLPSGL